MATVNDRWRDEIVQAYNYSNAAVTPVNAAGASAYFRVSGDYEMSKERVFIIARRILHAQRHDPNSLVSAVPLFEKDRLRIQYTENTAVQSVDVEIQDPQDIEQLEILRVNLVLINRLPPPTLSSCTVQ